MLQSLKHFVGLRILAIDGALGKVQDFLLDDQTWTLRYLVAEIGSRKRILEILVGPEHFEDIAPGDRFFRIRLEKASLLNSPTIDADRPVSLQQSVPWQIIYQGAEGFVVTGNSREKMERSWERRGGDPHLRSMRELIGYCVYALDGEVGHVKDFLVYDSLYLIPYMCVNVRKPRRDRLMIISTDLVETVSWLETKVYIDATSAAVKSAPALSPGQTIDQDYEMKLMAHYDQTRYSR